MCNCDSRGRLDPVASVPCFHAPPGGLRSGALTRLGKSTQEGRLGKGGPSDFRPKPDPVFGFGRIGTLATFLKPNSVNQNCAFRGPDLHAQQEYHPTLIILSKVHTRIQVRYLVRVAVARERGPALEFAKAALSRLAPARVVNAGIHVGIEAILVRIREIPCGRRLLLDETNLD